MIDQIPGAKDPSRNAFFLGARDIIINAARVRRHLEQSELVSISSPPSLDRPIADSNGGEADERWTWTQHSLE